MQPSLNDFHQGKPGYQRRSPVGCEISDPWPNLYKTSDAVFQLSRKTRPPRVAIEGLVYLTAETFPQARGEGSSGLLPLLVVKETYLVVAQGFGIAGPDVA